MTKPDTVYIIFTEEGFIDMIFYDEDLAIRYAEQVGREVEDYNVEDWSL